VVVGTLSYNRRTRSTAVTGGEPNQLARLVVADGGQRARTSCDDDASATTQHHFVISDRNAQSTDRCDYGECHQWHSGRSLKCHNEASLQSDGRRQVRKDTTPLEHAPLPVDQHELHCATMAFVTT
jgi:hypothetical protein